MSNKSYQSQLIASGAIYQNASKQWSRKCPKCHAECAYNGPQAQGNAVFHARKGTYCLKCRGKLPRGTKVIPMPISMPAITIANTDAPQQAPEALQRAARIQAILRDPWSEEPPITIPNAQVTRFSIECVLHGNTNMRMLCHNGWLYSYYCTECGSGVKVRFNIKPSKDTKAVTEKENCNDQQHRISEEMEIQ